VTEKSEPETAGMRAMFWVWIAVIAGGLAVMIAIPLTGA
jgi:hypothetical protein